MSDEPIERPENLASAPHLADALDSDRFKQFLDHIPFAIVVAELKPSEVITYANFEFERLMEMTPEAVQGRAWTALPRCVSTKDAQLTLNEALIQGEEYIGTFVIPRGDATVLVDAWSNVIQADDGAPVFRLVTLAEIGLEQSDRADDALNSIREKDTLLRELQHRVKNNLQMITALIRMEARNVPDKATGARFDRLAGRVSALALLYDGLAGDGTDGSVDLGIYLSQIAAGVMQAHASEGIRLDLKVDTWPVSVNVAMPTGLVVNELLINSLKHAFPQGQSGTITLHSLVDETGCKVTVSDDGVGLHDGVTWPQSGKLGALIAQSLRQNARAKIDVKSAPGKGVRVTIFFAREDAAPASA